MSNPSPLESIFFAALEKQSSAERKAFLDEACAGNDELRGSVERMLAAQADAGSFLESPLPGVTAAIASSQLSEQPGSVIGPYKLLEQIGEGGMGTVFMAEQQEPVRRRVALKVIKPGMDTRQVIARFEAERQALAVMDHPSIARVLDAGATESGRPYFVMELVRGVPITTYCDENNLAVRERLELFASVCQAIQHAHTKGIVHRDIKPTNVLVTRQDGRAVVKVIDFGVAKAMGQQLTEKTLFTNFAQMIGTPLYMSPEQAERSGVDIDTRSDIYSLGVLLYELLTGSTPVDEEQMKKAAFDEVRRIIREDEPQTPSARISGSHTLPAIAAHRHIEPARLSKLVRGELDWIVMKALEKDRSRRYETANGFAADLLHYLNDEAVQACPPSARYRFGKFARRNRVAITTVTLVALALVLGTIVSTWQAIRAETARAAEVEQRQIAEDQRKVAEDERSEAEKQRELAEANFQNARKAVDEYFTLVSESTLLDVPGLQPLRKELLEAALRFYEKTAVERTNDPGVLADVAVTYLRVAEIDHAIGRNDDAIAAIGSALNVIDRLRRDYPGATEQHRRLAGFWKGYRPAQSRTEMPKDPRAALKTLQRLIETWQELADEDPEQPAFQSDLASLCYSTGTLLASVNERESLRYHERSKGILEKLVVDQPDAPEHRADLARVYQDMVGKLSRAGRLAEAEAAQNRSLSLREELVAKFPNAPQYRGELARFLSQSVGAIAKQQPAEAEKMYQRAVDLSLSLVLEFPEATIFCEVLAANLSDWGKYAHAGGKKDQIEHFNSQAKELVEKVTETFEAQIRDRPKDQRAREQLANFCYQVAEQLSLQGNLAALAERLHQRAFVLFAELTEEFPGDRNLATQIATIHGDAAAPLWDRGRADEAAEHYHAAVATLEKRARKFPAQSDDTRLFANMAIYLARIMSSGARTTDVQETCRLCLRATEILDGKLKEDPIRRAFLAVAVRAYAERLLKEPERRPEAEQMMTWSTPIVEQTIKDVALLDKLTADPTAPKNDRHHAGETQYKLAMFLAWTNRAAQADEMWLRAIRSFEAIDERFMIPYALGDYRQYLTEQVEQLVKSGRADEAVKLLHKVIDAFDTLAAEHPLSAELYRAFQVDILLQLTAILAAGGHAQEALVAARKRVDISEALTRDFPNNKDYRQRMASALTMLIEALVKAGQGDEATTTRQRTELDPKNDQLSNTLGVAYYRAGNWQDAIECPVRPERQTSSSSGPAIAPRRITTHRIMTPCAAWAASLPLQTGN